MPAVSRVLPQISIIIPAHNMAPWIGETLGSVLAQDYPTSLLEAIVIDDGSTDRPCEVVGSMLEPTQLKWMIESIPHGGVARARNLGARLARGEWLQFLDADDLLHRQKLSIQGRVSCAVPQTTAVIFSPWTALDQTGAGWVPRSPMRNPVLCPEPLLALLQSDNFIATGSQLFRRSWFESVGGFHEPYSYLEDVDLALRLAMAGGRFVAAASPDPLFFYRQRPDSQSKRDRLAFAQACVRNARLVETYWRHGETPLSSAQVSVLVEIYGNALRTFFERDRGRFHALLAHVNLLKPGYCPTRPLALRRLSRLFGYPFAERAALLWRRARGVAHCKLSFPPSRTAC